MTADPHKEAAPPAGSDEAAPYAHLASRAEAYLIERGGSAPEEALIAHVFGSTGTPDLWRPLLRSLLAPAERLGRRADGCWMVAANHAVGAVNLLRDFVAIDVETTGLKPSSQRIVEIAAIRYADGEEIERFESLVNPGRRLPKYVAELTGLDDATLAEAPPFSDVAEQVLAAIGGALLVGHNVGFDIAFLNAELQRLGRPILINERLDTMGLAVRLMPGTRKPGLQTVAEKLGVVARSSKRHRAGMDAAIAAGVALQLAEHARQAGYASLDEVRGLGASLPRRPHERHARALRDRSLLADIPHAPGVYLMKNEFGQIVYVGKSKNLRDRVGSYFSQQVGFTRKMDGLIESLAAIDIVRTGSELEALLLESQLIRRYQPRYNTAQRSHEQYPFIRVDVANAWPRITLSKARRDDGAVYFGPFRSAVSARKTVDLLNRILPLRTCSRSFRDARSYGSPCIEMDLGRCLGPCVGKADRDEYQGLVRHVVDFLDGRDEALYELIWADLEDAAARLDFERAGRLRRELQHVTTIVGAQRQLRETIETATCLLALPAVEEGGREIMLIAGGRLWAQFQAEAATDPAELAVRLERSWRRLCASGPLRLDHQSVDEAHILHRWLARLHGGPSCLDLADDPDWSVVAHAVMAIPADELAADMGTGNNPEAANDEPDDGVNERTDAAEAG
ncbi:MAG: GIY-YIG nuclease family protein [Thermomicrobiales bacterium]|nr:GIY-YIG nuclease family protein [Thermomicrobiales bacterium]